MQCGTVLLSLNHMVEQAELNTIFKSLSDPTRRDILTRLQDGEHNIGELVERYSMSFSAVAKHIAVLEKAKLVSKRKSGKEQIISINGAKLELASEYLQNYAQLWNNRFDRLEQELDKERHHDK